MSTTADKGPNSRPERLRAELRGFRSQCGLSLPDATRRLVWPEHKLVDIEYGEVAVSESDLIALLNLYGVDQPDDTHRLRELTRTDRERTWWEPYRDAIPEQYFKLICAESDASRITHFHPTLVPGQLQNRPYATSVTRETTLKPSSAEDQRAKVDVRMRRQHEVLHRFPPTTVTAIFDEPALYRRIGSDAVMRDQLDHLVRLIATGDLTIVVVPVASGAHPGALGAFMLLEYDDNRIDDVLCFEGMAGNVIVRDQPALLREYRQLADRLIATGARDDAAVDLILTARRQFA